MPELTPTQIKIICGLAFAFVLWVYPSLFGAAKAGSEVVSTSSPEGSAPSTPSPANVPSPTPSPTPPASPVYPNIPYIACERSEPNPESTVLKGAEPAPTAPFAPSGQEPITAITQVVNPDAADTWNSGLDAFIPSVINFFTQTRAADAQWAILEAPFLNLLILQTPLTSLAITSAGLILIFIIFFLFVTLGSLVLLTNPLSKKMKPNTRPIGKGCVAATSVHTSAHAKPRNTTITNVDLTDPNALTGLTPTQMTILCVLALVFILWMYPPLWASIGAFPESEGGQTLAGAANLRGTAVPVFPNPPEGVILDRFDYMFGPEQKVGCKLESVLEEDLWISPIAPFFARLTTKALDASSTGVFSWSTVLIQGSLLDSLCLITTGAAGLLFFLIWLSLVLWCRRPS